MGVAGNAALAQWERDGWCLLEGLLSAEEVAAAQAALPALFPTAEEFAADVDPARNAPFRDDSHRVLPAVSLRGRLAQRRRRPRARSSTWPSSSSASPILGCTRPWWAQNTGAAP